MRTVVGVLPSVAEAQNVAHQFERLGIARNEINVVPAEADRREWKKVERSKRSDAEAAREGALRGAGFGLLLSGLVLALPGVKPYLAGSTILTLCAAAFVGAVLVSIMVMIDNMGQSHEEAALYEEAVREKGVVLAAHVTESRASEILAALSNYGARDVHAETYRYAHQYPCDTTVTAH